MENLNTVDIFIPTLWKGDDILQNKDEGQSSAILH